MSTPQPFSDPHQVELAAVLGFDPGDLAANRQGTLSVRQVALLRRDQRRRTWPSVVAMGVLAAALLAVAAFSTAALIPRLLAAGGGLLLVGYGVLEAWAAERAVTQSPDQVGAISWRIDEGWRPVQRLQVIEFQVEGRWFMAGRALAACLREGQRYRLYYYAGEWSYPGASINTARLERRQEREHLGSYRILSMEPIGRGA